VEANRTHNYLIVSDLHFGEDLLPGISTEKRDTVELGARQFCGFLTHFAARKEGGLPWRLVIAGDLFDFMSLVVPADAVAQRRVSRDERLWGANRSGAASVERMRAIGRKHAAVLRAMWEFVLAGHEIDIIVGNHDIELLQDEVVQCLAQLFVVISNERNPLMSSDAKRRVALARIRVVPWYIYEAGLVWIEHGHQYDEACSFEYALAPWHLGTTGEFLMNVDYAAVRYLATTAPELDAHGAEQWSTVGYVRYAASHGGVRAFVKSYVAFAASMFHAQRLHRSNKHRELRRQCHQSQIAKVAHASGLDESVVLRIDRLSRAPLTMSWRRLIAMLALDVWGVLALAGVAVLLLLVLAPWYWILLGGAGTVLGARALLQRYAATHVASQLPMRRIPEQIAATVDAPVIVFGHTHDPLRLELANGVVYLNCGTWLPATRPGLMRSFTFVRVLVASADAADSSRAEMMQWTDGDVRRFTAETSGSAAATRGQ
jgi:UDP-2,3-diacylglucosamine pyrophosphatase LpxH